MKKFISIFLAVVMAVLFTACDGGKQDELPALEAPVSVNISSTGLIEWDAVEHATSYLLTVNEDTHDLTETSFQLTSDKLNLDLEFSVIARAEGYKDSPAAYGFYNPMITVSVSGADYIGAGKSSTYTATVEGAVDNEKVVWSLSVGGQYATIDEDGTLTAKSDLTDNVTVTVRAASSANPKFYAEKKVELRAKVELTQGMLDEAATHPKVEYVGILNADIYSIGAHPTFQRRLTLNTLTSLDGEYWYSIFTSDVELGLQRQIYYKKDGDYVKQVGLSLNNDEQLYPLVAEDGSEELWENAGLYNAFVGPDKANPKALKAEDFTYDDDKLAWKYTGSDQTLAERMVSSADPYGFVPKNHTFWLNISRGVIVGFSAESESDYSIVPGYRSEMTIDVRGNTDEEAVEVPKVATYDTKPEHEALTEAINAMKGLTSYKATVRHLQYDLQTGGMHELGYFYTVTEDTVLYQDFTWDMRVVVEGSDEDEYIYDTDGQNVYGYKQNDDETYYLFYEDKDGTYYPTRVYEGSVDDKKLGFDFAAPIFRHYSPDGNAKIYQVTSDMLHVATEFYPFVDSLDQLYGLYTSATAANGTSFLPTVTVEDGHIVKLEFFYNMTMLYGLFEVEFSEFDTATIEPITITGTRKMPQGWSDIPFNSMAKEGEDYYGMTYDEVIKARYGANAEVPYFLEDFGDSCMFNELYAYEPAMGNTVMTVATLIEAPMDMDYTLDSTVRKLQTFFKDNGFTFYRSNATAYGFSYEYRSDDWNAAITLISEELAVLVWPRTR